MRVIQVIRVRHLDGSIGTSALGLAVCLALAPVACGGDSGAQTALTVPGSGGVTADITTAGGSGGSMTGTGLILQGGASASFGGVSPTTVLSSSGGASVASGGAASVTGSTALGGTATGGGGGASSLGGTAAEGGTTSTGGTTATSSTSTVFNPCPALPAPCKIMPSGDSITVGAQSTDTGGYRVPLFATSLVNKKSLTFVGPSGAGPATVSGVTFPELHDGHSGYIIDTVGTRKGLLPLVEQNLTKHAPHIVLLMIGTNDVNSQVDLANASTRMATLLDKFLTLSPNTLLVVAQLIPTRTDSLNTDVQTFNQAVKTLVSERAKTGKHIQLVDMYSAFTANSNYKTDWLFDGLHPNDAGYAVMAKNWYSAISGYLR